MTDVTLARAREGDSDAFRDLTDQYRRELQVHCYRMLGSFQDAEDLLQETLLSAWQALGRFDGRSLRAWLYRIATNYLRDGARRPKAANVSESRFFFDQAMPSDEPWWLEPYPNEFVDDVELGPEARYDTRESIALSFVAGLQRLPVQQRAALVLRDVLGFSASEVAEMLETTPASVNSALQRARSRAPDHEGPDSVRIVSPGEEAKVVDRFVDAFQRGDLDGVVALLTDDATFSMPPEPFEFHGPRVIAEFLRSLGFWGQRLKLVPTRANNQPAYGYYLPDPHADIHRASGIMVLTLTTEGISAITRFGDRGLLARFGLPRTVASR
jgi:RNA polymerase sigma-70 factor, ECF subfamily